MAAASIYFPHTLLQTHSLFTVSHAVHRVVIGFVEYDELDGAGRLVERGNTTLFADNGSFT